jgi:hypothetical protein
MNVRCASNGIIVVLSVLADVAGTLPTCRALLLPLQPRVPNDPEDLKLRAVFKLVMCVTSLNLNL